MSHKKILGVSVIQLLPHCFRLLKRDIIESCINLLFIYLLAVEQDKNTVILSPSWVVIMKVLINVCLLQLQSNTSIDCIVPDFVWSREVSEQRQLNDWWSWSVISLQETCNHLKNSFAPGLRDASLKHWRCQIKYPVKSPSGSLSEVILENELKAGDYIPCKIIQICYLWEGAVSLYIQDFAQLIHKAKTDLHI